jgi:hypothetical protein
VFSLSSRAKAYADDGYIKAKVSVALQVLAELKHVLKQDAGLELNVSKTPILPKGTTQQVVFDVAHSFLAARPALTQLSGDISLAPFCPEGFIGIGVPIGTDAFVRNFVAKTCRAIIDDVEKLDAMQDGVIHYQLLRFCQATRLQYINLGAFSQERQDLWLPKDDLRNSSSWSSPPLLLLRDIHSKLLSDYNCKEGCAPSQSQANVGAGARLSSQDGVSQQQQAAPLSIPHLNLLIETSIVRDESSDSNAAVTVIPSQHRVALKILSHRQPFRDLKLRFASSRRAEQLCVRSQQRIVATVEDSVLRTEMSGLESQEENAPKRILWFKPMSWLGQIRPHRRDEAGSASL